MKSGAHSNSNPSTICHPAFTSAFTIVELLVVIVVIGILAAITIVSYTGITQKATVASLNSDLDNASKLLRMFNVSNSTYPTTISTNCTTNPDTASNKCLSFSASTTYNYKVSPTDNRIFCLDVTKNSTSYNVTQEGQLLAGPCPVLNLDAGNKLSYAGAGTIWKDLSGNDNNGTLNNGVAYSSVNGGVMNFDGVDDWVSIGSLNNLAGNTETVEFWGYQRTNKDFGCFLDSSLNGSDSGVRFSVGYYHNSSPYFSVHVGDGTTSERINYGYTIPFNVWQHYAVVLNGNKVSFYKNGSIYNTLTTSKTLASGTYRIANGYNGAGYMDGMVGDVRIFNAILSPSDIIQNYNTTKGRYGL